MITTKHVLREGADITHVSHDLDDHGWRFHYAGENKTEDAMVVSRSSLALTSDSSIAAFSRK